MTIRRAAGLWLASSVLLLGCGAPEVPPAKAPDIAPGSPATDSNRRRFLEHFARKEYEPALDAALAAIEAAPADREPYMMASKTLIQAGRDQDGPALFGRLATSHPGRPEPWFFKGFHEARLARWADAQASLERAAAMAPGDAEAHFRLGLVLQERRDVARSVEELRKARDLDPDSAGKAAALMVALSTAGRDGEADTIAAEVTARAPRSAEARYAVAKLRLRQSRWREAEEALRGALELDPSFEPARRDLGVLVDRARR